jgi:hypothetical protein
VNTPSCPMSVARFVFVHLAVLSPAWTTALAQTDGGSSPRPWYERLLVGMEVGPTGAQSGCDSADSGYATRFNGRDIVRKCVEAHCQYVVIWSRDGEFAYYDSKVMPKAPGLGQRDVLREAVDEAARHKLPVIVYCVVQYGTQAMRDHPEYRMVDPQGKPIERVCFNTGYRDFVKRLLLEMLAYGIDGFHIDMMDLGFGPPYGCWCANCRKRFEAEYGRPMPKGVTWDDDWDRMLEFRCNTSARYEKELTAFIRSKAPRVSVDFNYHGNPPFSWEVGQRPVLHAGNADFVTGETGVWAFGALQVALNARFYAAATPGRRFQVAMDRGVRMYHDQTTRPLNDIRWELLTLLSHGAFVTMIDKTAYDGWLDQVGYERTGAAFSEALSKREHFGQKPVMDVGIYFSSRTRDWYGREKPEKYFQSFVGAHKALTYEHIPWGVLLDENATLETLKQHAVVWLANAAVLSADEVALFRRYVEGGGRLVVTGLTGSLGRLGEPLTETVLSDLVGGTLAGRLDSLDNHVLFPKEGAPAGGSPALHEGIRLDWPFLVKGPAVVLKPTAATAVGRLMKPHRTLRQKQGKEGTDWPMSADAPVGPAILVNPIGKGVVLTFACSPDFATASEHAVVEARRLVRNAVRCLHPRPLVRITAPVNIEAVVTDDADNRTLRVHLLGYNSAPGCTPATNRPYIVPGPIEDAPGYRATIEIDRTVKEATAWNKATTVKREGNRIEATVEEIHEILVVRY